MSGADFVTAFAPASIGNVGVGYDILGLAIAGAGDRVAARRTDGKGISIREVRGLDGERTRITTRHQSQRRRYGTTGAMQAAWS
jgi:homoserine kinase